MGDRFFAGSSRSAFGDFFAGAQLAGPALGGALPPRRPVTTREDPFKATWSCTYHVLGNHPLSA
jgi:hypothetical protein